MSHPSHHVLPPTQISRDPFPNPSSLPPLLVFSAAAPIPSPPSMESSQPANPATRTGLLPVLPPPSRGFLSSNLSLPPVPLAGARRRCRGFGAAPPSSLVRGRRCPDPAMADLFHTFRRPPDLPGCLPPLHPVAPRTHQVPLHQAPPSPRRIERTHARGVKGVDRAPAWPDRQRLPA